MEFSGGNPKNAKMDPIEHYLYVESNIRPVMPRRQGEGLTKGVINKVCNYSEVWTHSYNLTLSASFLKLSSQFWKSCLPAYLECFFSKIVQLVLEIMPASLHCCKL